MYSNVICSQVNVQIGTPIVYNCSTVNVTVTVAAGKKSSPYVRS